MNIHDAILAAADQIERHPETFAFSATVIPGSERARLVDSGYYFRPEPRNHGCKSPGCALGWIGAFVFSPGELRDYALSFASVPKRMGMGIGNNPIREFYDRMDDISGWLNEAAESWRNSPAECARCLRLYAAAKYHAPQPAIPDSVREIFSEAPCQTPSPILSNLESLTTGSETSPTESSNAICA